MGELQHKKLILIGSTSNPVHIRNYYNLIKDYFDEVLIVGPVKVDFCASVAVDFVIKNPVKIYQNILRLRKIMLDFQPSIVHVHQANSFGFYAGLANKGRFPHVLTTWGDDVLIFPHKNFIFRTLTRTSLKYADAITADAEIMRKAIIDFFGDVEVVIANFGIEIKNIEIPQKEKILYSNRLHDDLYNIDQIIEGTKDFLKSNTDWKLIVAAVGKNTDLLKSMVKEFDLENQVEFVGFLSPEDNFANYLRAKIYISIPNTDGTSISLLESLAYGCLPLVSDLPANREWVHDGENGVVVHQMDFQDALKRVMALDAEKAISINKKIIAEKATKKANRAKFTAIYDRLLNK